MEYIFKHTVNIKMSVHTIICSQVVDAFLVLATTWACVTISCRILYSGETCSYGLTADSSIHRAHQTSYQSC